MILGGGAARHLGTEVHELLAQVEWLGDQLDYAGASAEGAKLAREFLISDRAAFMKSSGDNVTVWRERAFDVEIDGRAVSGIFDRVHILRGKDGTVLEAQVYDFKTDKDPSDLHEKYKEQLEDYARAAAKLLGLPRNNVQSHPVAFRKT
jgi:ATP-dependent exoDNAse (exonuclease V) beta subunit